MRSYGGGTLIQHDEGPHNKRVLDTDMSREKMTWRHGERRQLSASQGEKPGADLSLWKESTLSTPRSWTSGLQNSKKVLFCC